MDGAGFGAGNLGEEGMRRFLQAHRHTLLCEQLGLPSPLAGLSDAELAARMQADEERIAAEDQQAEAEAEHSRLDDEEEDLTEIIQMIQAQELRERGVLPERL